MVQGIAKRVVVVKFTETHLFEQAILLLRDGYDDSGVTEAQILQEANEIASQYQREQAYQPVKVTYRTSMGWGARIACIVSGAGLTGLMWLLLG